MQTKSISAVALSIVVSLSILSSNATAQVWVAPPSDAELGTPIYGGSGCPAGSMRIAFAPDKSSFSILFDQFVVKNALGGRGAISRLNCDVQIPINIPENYQMIVYAVDYRGFAGLPDRVSSAQLSTAFHFDYDGAPLDTAVFSHQFQGPLMDNYLVSTQNMAISAHPNARAASSYCGGQETFLISSALQLSSSNPNAQLTIDSIDGPSQSAIYYVTWKKCLLGSGRFSD